MAAAGLCCPRQARPGPLSGSSRQQAVCGVGRVGRSRSRLPLCRAQAGASRPFGGLPDGAGRQQPAPSQALAAGSRAAAAAEQQVADVPAVAEQAAALRALLQKLGRAATFADKVRRWCGGAGLF